MTTKTVSAREIARATSTTLRSAQRGLDGVPFEAAATRGGWKRLYRIDDLKPEMKAKVLAWLIDRSNPSHRLPAQSQVALAGRDVPAALAAPKPPAISSSKEGDQSAGAISSSAGRDDRAVAGRMPAPAPADSAGPSTLARAGLGALAKWQVEVATARAALIEECERLAGAGAVHISQAEKILVEHARTGALAPVLADLARLANARRGKNGRTLSLARLSAWRQKARLALTPSERIERLAPGGRGKKWTLTADVAAALAKYRQPNKPALRWCVGEIAGEKSGPVFNSLYARCRRELKKLPKPIFYAGRHSGAALKALQPFRRREFLSLEPNDVWVGDGHGAKLRIAHPETGNPFVPEVTVIVDVPTRYVVGWSVALSENCLAVSDALRHAVSRNGIPLVYYSDGGAGQTAKMLDAPLTGILGGLGIQHEVGRPGNPQARGVIERLWQTILIPLARRFATYQGKGADRETLRKVSIEIDRTLRRAKNGEVAALPRRLPSFPAFIAALEAEISAYNETHSHRSLPRINGAEHPTPAEYRARRLQGALPFVPQPQELAALFMPSVVRKAARGEVKLWNGVYFSRDLMLVDQEEVRVCYDIHDASYVLVRRISGELIARAELAGNRSGYMPQPLIERLRDGREARRRKLLEDKLDQVAAERSAATFERPTYVPPERSAEEKAAFAELEREHAAESAEPKEKPIELMGEWERYALWKKLRLRKAAGEVLDERLADFYEGYAETGECYLKGEEELGYTEGAA